MIARLIRMLPLLVVLAVVALVVYLVATYRYSPARAKEILIKLFTVITGVLCGFFGLVSLYAWGDHNAPVLDLSLSFLVTAFIALVFVRVCRVIFLRHYPAYRKKRMRAKWLPHFFKRK